MSGTSNASVALAAMVENIVQTTPVLDVHTHLYDPAFGRLLLWGIDDLLVYHYLIAEAFRYWEFPPEKFWALPKSSQAERIWDALFVQHSPISEACRGVVRTLRLLGLDVKRRDLPRLRRWFADWKPGQYIDHCLNLARVRSLCMTNSPFDPVEQPLWKRGFDRDARFHAALRIDPLLLAWKETIPALRRAGYSVGTALSSSSIKEVRRFLADWTKRMRAAYLMVSLPPDFMFPADNVCAKLLEKAVLPHCEQHGLPFALMLGVKRSVNPALQCAGDGGGRSRLEAVENLCRQFPGNKFLVTVLSRENQHELCVVARKFRNLHIFGCWWFTNIPSIVEEMTRMRLDLIGLSVTLQHSDARVLDQVLYKWDHARRVIAGVLVDKYTDLQQNGWEPTPAEIKRDVADLFGGSFERFCKA